MRYQDEIVRMTQRALDDVCRAALAIPSEKREWVPMGAARSVLNQMQELAVAALWFYDIIQDLRITREPERDIDEIMVKAREITTVEECVERARTSTSDLCRAIAAFPDEALDVEVTLPFGAGQTASMADMLYMHAWNLTYHLGQINQMQLMLGDPEMH